MKFNKGDMVFHKKLKLTGEFIEYDWTGEDVCLVRFDNPNNPDDCRRVSTNLLEKIDGERRVRRINGFAQ